MSRTSPLGPEQGRVKFDVRMPAELADTVGVIARRLGVPKGTLITLATSILCVQLLPIATVKNRRETLSALRAMFQKTVRSIAQMTERSHPAEK